MMSVYPFVRGSPRGPVMATRQAEMKPGDFLKVLSFATAYAPLKPRNRIFGYRGTCLARDWWHISPGFCLDRDYCLRPDRDREWWYHSDWTDLSKVRCGRI